MTQSVAAELKTYLFEIERSVQCVGDDVEFSRFHLIEAENQIIAQIKLHRELLDNFSDFDELPDVAIASFEKLAALKNTDEALVKEYLADHASWVTIGDDKALMLKEYEDEDDYKSSEPELIDYTSEDFDLALYNTLKEKGISLEELPFTDEGCLYYNDNEDNTAAIKFLGVLDDNEKAVLNKYIAA